MSIVSGVNVRCEECPLRGKALFRAAERAELDFIAELRGPQLAFPARSELLGPDAPAPVFYSLFEGWAFRYRSLEIGGRQIVDFLLPGDLIGMHASMSGVAHHGVCSLTAVRLCPLQADRFLAVFPSHPGLVHALMQTLLVDEERYDRRLLLLGRQRPTQRLAFLMLELHDRLVARGMATRGASGGTCEFPLTYEHMMDALGLSRSQLARSLGELRDRGWTMLANQRLSIYAAGEMARFCGYDGLDERPRALV